MNVVVQNDCKHILSRHDVEEVLLHLPSSWKHNIRNVTPYQGQEEKLYATYHQKEGVVGLFCPKQHDGLTKADALETLLVALVCIEDRGELPEKLSGSTLHAYRAEAARVLGSQVDG